MGPEAGQELCIPSDGSASALARAWTRHLAEPDSPLTRRLPRDIVLWIDHDGIPRWAEQVLDDRSPNPPRRPVWVLDPAGRRYELAPAEGELPSNLDVEVGRPWTSGIRSGWVRVRNDDIELRLVDGDPEKPVHVRLPVGEPLSSSNEDEWYPVSRPVDDGRLQLLRLRGGGARLYDVPLDGEGREARTVDVDRPLADNLQGGAFARDSWGNTWTIRYPASAGFRSTVSLVVSYPDHPGLVRELGLDHDDVQDLSAKSVARHVEQEHNPPQLIPLPEGRLLALVPPDQPDDGVQVYLIDPTGLDACVVLGLDEASVPSAPPMGCAAPPLSRLGGGGRPAASYARTGGAWVQCPQEPGELARRVGLDLEEALPELIVDYPGCTPRLFGDTQICIGLFESIRVRSGELGWRVVREPGDVVTSALLPARFVSSAELRLVDAGGLVTNPRALWILWPPAWFGGLVLTYASVQGGLLVVHLIQRPRRLADSLVRHAAVVDGRGFGVGSRAVSFFFGRHRALYTIVRALTAPRWWPNVAGAAPRARVVLIGGPPRIGKSWLLRAVEASLVHLSGSRRYERELPLPLDILVSSPFNVVQSLMLVVREWLGGRPTRPVVAVQVDWSATMNREEAEEVLADALQSVALLLYKESTLHEALVEPLSLAAMYPIAERPREWLEKVLGKLGASGARLVVLVDEALGTLQGQVRPTAAGELLVELLRRPYCSAVLAGPRVERSQTLRSLLAAASPAITIPVPRLGWLSSVLLVRTLAHLSPRQPTLWCTLRYVAACHREPILLQEVGSRVLESPNGLLSRRRVGWSDIADEVRAAVRVVARERFSHEWTPTDYDERGWRPDER